LSEFSSSGTPISPSTGYTGGGLGVCTNAIAIDTSGNVWVANESYSLSEFSSSGVAISPWTGYTGGGLNEGVGSIAVDASGNVWAPNEGTLLNLAFNLSELSGGGTPISSSTGYTGGGLNAPYAIAFDGSGNVWVANAGSDFVGLPGVWAGGLSEFSGSGTPISPSTPYTGGNIIAGEGIPNGIAVDSSGNVWLASQIAAGAFGNHNALLEFVGVAAPVMTPLVNALKNNKLGQRP
jgi:streptogramin lyase